MNATIDTVERREFDSLVKLSCGHEFVTNNPNLQTGYPCPCRECKPTDGAQPCTAVELAAVAGHYATIMRARGIAIGTAEEAAILRAAAIHDVWRVAFKRVLG